MQTGNSAYYLYELILRKLEQKNMNSCQWHLADINIFFLFFGSYPIKVRHVIGLGNGTKLRKQMLLMWQPISGF